MLNIAEGLAAILRTKVSGKMLRIVLVLLPLGLVCSHVTCPDERVCPDRSTCCDTDHGYECCPVPNAICCSDQAHCCPQGFRCNVQTQMCERPGGSMPIPWDKAGKPSSLSLPNQAVSNPKIAEQDECCLSSSGCCPVGFHCNQQKACVRDIVPHPWTELQDAPSTGSQGVVIYCDRKFYCPANNTCCKNSDDHWACCPYALGQCCQDKKHCCAYGYTCDRRSTCCIKEYSSIPAALKKVAKTN